MLIYSDHREAYRADVALIAGEITTHDVVLPSLAIAGDVRGELVGPLDGEEPLAMLRLQSIDGGATDAWGWAGQLFVGGIFGDDPDGKGVSAFAFEDLPRGQYRLTVIPSLFGEDGRRYLPESVVVSPPAENLRFQAEDVVAPFQKVRLRVVDALTGKQLSSCSLLVRWITPGGSFWFSEVDWESTGEAGELPPGQSFELVVGAPGYVPARASLLDGRPEGDTTSVDVELEPGWGAALVIVDAEGLLGGSEASLDDGFFGGLAGAQVVVGNKAYGAFPRESFGSPLEGGPAGAQVLVEGQALGASDESGLVIVRTAGPIAGYGVRLAGWSVLARHRFLGHARTPDGLGFVLMVRD
jgi:hypothetical protein